MKGISSKEEGEYLGIACSNDMEGRAMKVLHLFTR